ncbi:MAG: GlcNAc-transferase family protein [Pseudomonadota bacterium]
MTVFISIAAYRDPILPFTVSRALATAHRPDELHFGIVEQTPTSARGAPLAMRGAARLSYVAIDSQFARGPCWARAIGQSLYDNEDWYFQIDSHMDFDQGWDETLITQATTLMSQKPGRPGVVISSYPNPFVFDNGEAVKRPTTQKVLAHVVKPDAQFEPEHPVLGFEAHPLDEDNAVPGMHLGAGCLFASGAYAEAFPYDPWYYFHGEEQALAARLYTHGWDIFHMPGLPVYHLYNAPGSGAPARPLHWDPKEDEARDRSWWTLEEKSRARLKALLAGERLGVYGLGRERTMAQYAAFSGIDYAARTIGSHARVAQPTRV